MKHVFLLAFAVIAGVAQAAGWVRVTDVSQLEAGKSVVLACPAKGTTAGALSGNYLASVSATFASDESSIDSLGVDAEVWTLGGTSEAWTLSNGSGLLGATRNKKMAIGSGTTTWTIAISDGLATIGSTNSFCGRILYNVNDPRFLNYTSTISATMLLPTLYIEDDSEPAVTYTFEYAGYPDKSTHCGMAEYAEGKRVVLSKGKPTQTGKTFVGWLYGGKVYQAGETFVMPAENVSLVAQWNEASALQNTTAEKQARKVVRDNTIYIVVGERMYDIVGKPVK